VSKEVKRERPTKKNEYPETWGQRSKFVDLVSRAALGRDPRTLTPVLGAVRLVVGEDSRLLAQSTDLELRVSVRSEVGWNGKPFDVMVDPVVFGKIVKPKKKANDGPINLSVLPNPLPSASPRIKIDVDGLASSLLTPGFVEDFPEGYTEPTDERVLWTWPGKDLTTALQYLNPSICTDETRYSLNGVLFRPGDLVSTDGHRLHKITNPSSPDGCVEFDPVIVPRKVIGILLKLVGGSPVRFMTQTEGTEKNVDNEEVPVRRFLFRSDDWEIWFRQIDGEYPDTEQVYPSRRKIVFVVSVDRDQIIRSVTRALDVIGSPQFTGVAVHLPPPGESTLKITASSATVGEIKTEVEGVVVKDHREDGSTLKVVGVNAKYLQEAVKVFDSTVTLSFVDELLPVFVESEEDGISSLVMPIRL